MVLVVLLILYCLSITLNFDMFCGVGISLLFLNAQVFAELYCN